jgi:hypothetical protein
VNRPPGGNQSLWYAGEKPFPSIASTILHALDSAAYHPFGLFHIGCSWVTIRLVEKGKFIPLPTRLV